MRSRTLSLETIFGCASHTDVLRMAILRLHVPVDTSVVTVPSERLIVYAERFASFGLALVLLVSSLFAVVSARATTDALKGVALATQVNDAYQEARFDVGSEKALERKYRLAPDAETRARHLLAGQAVEESLLAAQRLSPEADRLEIQTIVAKQHAYMAAAKAMFAAVDARQLEGAAKIERARVDPLFRFIESRVSARAAAQRSSAATVFGYLHTIQANFIGIALLLSLASLICLAMYLWVLRSYKRRLFASHEHEVERLANAAMIDHLTGTGNHRAYKEEFAREVSRAARHDDALALALIDIDEMKLLNDQSGHMHGDEVLQMLGSLLRDLRVEDRPFRVGGDEFAVLLPNTSQADAETIMERLRESMHHSMIRATISVGVAALSGKDCDAETLQGQADAALYAAKRAGRNTVVGFDAAVDEMWLLSPTKVRQLRSLIEADNMTIAFQPIWDVDRCTILAYEALARPAPQYGFSGPQDVFDLAERVGRAHEIDAVCRRATLARAHELPSDMLLFINMTPQSLDHGHLDPKAFAAEIIAAGLEPQRVVIEITERSIVQVDVVVKVASELQRLGFRIALDDTGAGNAGLEMLSRLPVEFVKIDRAIIVKALTDRSARGVLAGIIAIAKETGAYVIAEGIEDIAMLDLVCDRAHEIDPNRRAIQGVQGYLLLRPSERLAAFHEASLAQAVLRDVVQRNERALPRALSGAESAD